MGQIFADCLYDAVVDCLKVIPILFLAYLLVSYLSHDHSHKFSKFLSKNKKTSVLYASFLGCVPQCGFSSVIADLYSEKTVSLGTLIAVFVATSDEAIPLMFTNTNRIVDLLMLIGIKIVLAVFWGYSIDGAISLIKKHHSKTKYKNERLESHHSEHNHEEFEEGHHHSCGHIHTDKCADDCGHEHGHCCVDNVFLDAFMHTFEIVLYIFVATFVINLIVSANQNGYFQVDIIQTILTDNPYIQILIASLIGLIPNCASSVVLVELYMLYGSLTFPALLAGLTSGAGVGLFILIARNKKHPLQNLGIIFLQYAIGVVSGLLLTLIF